MSVITYSFSQHYNQLDLHFFYLKFTLNMSVFVVDDIIRILMSLLHFSTVNDDGFCDSSRILREYDLFYSNFYVSLTLHRYQDVFQVYVAHFSLALDDPFTYDLFNFILFKCYIHIDTSVPNMTQCGSFYSSLRIFSSCIYDWWLSFIEFQSVSPA